MPIFCDTRLPVARQIIHAGLTVGDVIEGRTLPGHHPEAPVRLRLLAHGDSLCLWRVATLVTHADGTAMWRDDGESAGWSLAHRTWTRVSTADPNTSYDLPMAAPPTVDTTALLAELRTLADPVMDIHAPEVVACLERLVDVVARHDHALRSWAIHACQSVTATMSARACAIWEAVSADLPIATQLDAVLRSVLMERACQMADQCAAQDVDASRCADHQDHCATVTDLPPIATVPPQAEDRLTARPDHGPSLHPQAWVDPAADPTT
jgi:hypothetical protein